MNKIARGTTPTAYVIGECARRHPVTALQTAESIRCRQCGTGLLSWRTIVTRPTLATCGTACTAATSHLCECSCRGRMHGARWAGVA